MTIGGNIVGTTINLDLLFERTMRALMMVCDGRTTSFEGRITGGGNPDRSPRATELDEKGHTDYAMDELQEEWAKAGSSEQRRVVIDKALGELKRARYAPDRRHVRGTKEWRIAVGSDPRSRAVIAHVYDIGEATVSRLRQQVKIELRKAA